MQGTWPGETPGAKEVEDTRRYLRQAMDRLISSTQLSRREAHAWIEHVARANKASLRQVAEAIVTQRTVWAVSGFIHL
jgi:AmiR/NasT family two-component response regulator